MSKPICEICGSRVATRQVTVQEGNRRKTIYICSQDYARLRRQSSPRSSFESLFWGDSFLNDFFDENGGENEVVYHEPRSREAHNIEKFFSEHTKELIQNAAQIAMSKFGRKTVDTEHLLYSILDSDVIKEILKHFKINEEDLKGFIDYNAPKENNKLVQEMSISPRVKKVLELAFSAGNELGHGYIGPEHLLIALIEEGDGIAGELLRKYGLTAESVRQKVIKIVGKGAREGKVESQSTTPKLDKFSRDMTDLARSGRLDPVIGRATEIETTIEILSRRTKNNPVLIGEPGVGKTAIVEGLAQRIVNNDVPETLQGKRVVEFNVNSLVAGSKYRGEMEERMKEVLEEIAKNKDGLVLFIDELHTIMSAGVGGDEGGLSVANVLKPMLARGELHLIGATTLSEYQKHIEKDAALERRFQPVFVSEPTIDQTIEILRGLRDKYEAHHKVKITDEAITAAAELSGRYIVSRFLPDKAVDLIDQAASRVRIGFMSQDKEMQRLNEEIMRLVREEEAAVSHKKDGAATELAEKVKALKKEKELLNEKWKLAKGGAIPEVSLAHIAEVVAKITGIPVAELTREEKEKLLKMEEKLHERIISQDEAVSAVSNAIRVARAGLGSSNKPQATFLFLGPTGVGKTELVKALAWTVFGSEDAVIRLDMSEYMERHAVARLIGAPPGYIGYEEGGQLTEAIRRRPYSVILLDEIEKAHPDVFNILLQVFDDGRLTDGKGRVVDFTNTIIIATSNLGSELIQKNEGLKGKEKKKYSVLKNDLMNILRAFFRPEFLNRIDDIIVFRSLSRDDIRRIVTLQLDHLGAIAMGQNIALKFDDSIIEFLTKEGYAPEFGARELRRRIKTEIENSLAKEMLAGAVKPGDQVRVVYADGQVRYQKNQ